MAAPQPTAPYRQLPPELPSLPEVSPKLSDYLRTFSLWAKKENDTKLSSATAEPTVLLQAADAAPGTTPAVYKVQVKTDGTLVSTPVALGSGDPGTTIPSGGNWSAAIAAAVANYLPLAGGTLTGALTGVSATLSGALSAASATLTGALSAASVTLSGALTAVSATIDGAAGTYRAIAGSTAGLNRWVISLGDNTAEGGSNAGSNFVITGFDDTGAYLNAPLTITRKTAGLIIAVPPNAANDAAAASAGVPVGGVYRNSSALMVRVT